MKFINLTLLCHHKNDTYKPNAAMPPPEGSCIQTGATWGFSKFRWGRGCRCGWVSRGCGDRSHKTVPISPNVWRGKSDEVESNHLFIWFPDWREELESWRPGFPDKLKPSKGVEVWLIPKKTFKISPGARSLATRRNSCNQDGSRNISDYT